MSRRTWAIGSLLILASLLLFEPGRLLPIAQSLVFRLLLLVIMLLILLLWLRPSDQKRITDDPPQFGPVDEVEPEQIEKAQQQAGLVQFLSGRQAKHFALAVTAPAEVRKRVVDSYELEERTLRQTVTIEGLISKRFNGVKDGQPEIAYIPVLTPAKGTLLDGLSVVDGTGEELPILSYRETILASVTILRLLLASACRGQRNLTADGLTPSAIAVEKRAIGLLIARNTKAKPITQQRIDAVCDAIKALPRLPDDHPAAKVAGGAVELAAKFVERLADHYVIIAPIRPKDDGRFLIKYSQILIPDLVLKHGRGKVLSTLIGSATVALGARPVDLTIGVENASTCQSYHLRVESVESQGLYLVEQQAIEFDNTLKETARGAPTRPHPRFRKRLGQAHAHFYVRYFPEPANGDRPRVRFRYFEVPPGSLLRAGITALAGLFLVWLIGIITRFSGGDPGTDAPAVLLAFPALAATWLGFERRSSRLLEGTYAARRCLLFTALTSIGAAAVFMAHKQIKGFGEPLPWGASLLGVADVYWASLLLFALVNFTVVAYKYVVHTWEYCHLAGRPQPGNTTQRSWG